MIKVKDTLKRNVKFESVEIVSERLVDENGDIVGQIIKNLPDGVTEFELQINVSLPQIIVNEDGEILSDDE